ncbi:MAG: TonB-dependent receptor plug domain-containing protein, partial [Planctomycetota bacterium]
PTVVSATRQATGTNLTAVPVSVITAKEIHQRGAMSLPELFEYVPGMDVVRASRNETAIGIQGMFGAVNDRILCLVDGNKTADVVSGSTNFQAFPVFMDDIKQIEVVKGPSGAAWGANAFFGVINVITKDPSETQGTLASVTTDQYGDSTSELRYGGMSGRARWRITGGFEHHIASATALNKSTSADDAGYTADADSRLVFDATPHTKITFGVSFLHQESDVISYLDFAPTVDNNRTMARTFLRVDSDLTPDLKTNWTALFNYNDDHMPAQWSSIDREAGLEGQFDYSGLQDHQISYGASFRYMRSQGFGNDPQGWQFADNPNEEFWGGLFAVDRWQLGPRTWIEMQARGDLFKLHQNTQKGDWSGRIAGIFALDNNQNQVIRISGAKSYRAPTLLLRASEFGRIALPTPPFPANSFGLNIASANRIDDETIWALEAGYTGRFNTNFSMDINTYYHRYMNLISAEETSSVGPQEFYTLGNIAGAIGYGGEIELNYHIGNLQARAYYAYAGFHIDTMDAVLRATPPSPNKAGCELDWNFDPDWTALLLYRYNDLTPGDSGAPQSVRAFHQMDINLLYAPVHGNAEFMIGLHDVLNDYGVAIADIGTYSGTEPLPGRALVARGQINF